MSDNTQTPQVPVPPSPGAPVKLPPLKLPPKPVPAASGSSPIPPSPLIPPAAGIKPPSAVPPPPGPLKPPAVPGIPATSSAPKPPGAPSVPLSPTPKETTIPVVTPPQEGVVEAHQPKALRPQSITPLVAAKPMPQATIKLQQAPAPAAARKPAFDAALKDDKSENIATESESDVYNDNVDSNLELPMPILIAAAVLALVAFGIQIWTYIS